MRKIAIFRHWDWTRLDWSGTRIVRRFSTAERTNVSTISIFQIICLIWYYLGRVIAPARPRIRVRFPANVNRKLYFMLRHPYIKLQVPPSGTRWVWGAALAAPLRSRTYTCRTLQEGSRARTAGNPTTLPGGPLAIEGSTSRTSIWGDNTAIENSLFKKFLYCL